MAEDDSYEARAAARAAKRASKAVPVTAVAPVVTVKKGEVSAKPVATTTTTTSSSTGSTTTRRRFREEDFDSTPTPAAAAEEPAVEELHEEEATKEPEDEPVPSHDQEYPQQQQQQQEEEEKVEESAAPEVVVELVQESVEKLSVNEPPSSVSSTEMSSNGIDMEAELAALNKPKRSSRASAATTTASTSTASRSASASSTTDKFANAAKKFEQGDNEAQKPSSAGTSPALKTRKVIDAVVDENSEAAKLVKRIIDLDETVTWGLFDIQSNELVVHQSGDGTVEDLRKHLDHSIALYGYLRMGIGSEQRQKFVFIRWVGDKITPTARGRILNNEAVAKKIIKIMHIEVFTSFMDELTVPKLAARLAKAAGANYDRAQNEAQSSNTAFSQYKFQSRDFFASKEREGTVKGVVYTKAPLPKTTPVDLNARKFTVGATQGQKNIVLAVPGVDVKKEDG